MDNEPENEITITVFRLLVLDLLQLFQVLNQAMINILGMVETQALVMDRADNRQATSSKCQNPTPKEPWISTARSRDRPISLSSI
jgi:ANTH domain-containing protein